MSRGNNRFNLYFIFPNIIIIYILFFLFYEELNSIVRELVYDSNYLSGSIGKRLAFE